MSIRSVAGRTSRIAKRAGQWRARRPIRSVFVGIVLFLLLVPVWPYMPHCGMWASAADFRTIDGEMTPEFLEAMEIALRDDGVYYWRVGDRIYLRLLMGLFPSGSFDPGDGEVIDAQLQAELRLIDPHILGSHVGEVLLERVYRPPAYLEAIVEGREWFDYHDDCTFVRAVAFGEPPPPGYKPEPSPFRAPPGSK